MPLCIIIGAPFGSCCSLTIHTIVPMAHLISEAMEDVKSHKCFLFQWVPFGVCQRELCVSSTLGENQKSTVCKHSLWKLPKFQDDLHGFMARMLYSGKVHV